MIRKKCVIIENCTENVAISSAQECVCSNFFLRKLFNFIALIIKSNVRLHTYPVHIKCTTLLPQLQYAYMHTLT